MRTFSGAEQRFASAAQLQHGARLPCVFRTVGSLLLFISWFSIVIDHRRAAFVTGVSFGVVLGLLNVSPFTPLGLLLYGVAFGAVGATLIYRLRQSGVWLPSAGEAARIGAISGLAAGVTTRLLGVVLIIVGIFPRVPDARLFAFQQQWGIDYFTAITLLLIFGAALLASAGSAVARQYLPPPDEASALRDKPA